MRFALVYFIIRKLPFPFLRLHRQGHENAGDVMGHKCAGLFDMMYYVCAQMQRTIEIPRHPQAKTTDKPPKTWMPLQHQQNTSQTRLRIHARPNSTHAIDQYLQPQQCGFRQNRHLSTPIFLFRKGTIRLYTASSSIGHKPLTLLAINILPQLYIDTAFPQYWFMPLWHYIIMPNSLFLNFSQTPLITFSTGESVKGVRLALSSLSLFSLLSLQI